MDNPVGDTGDIEPDRAAVSSEPSEPGAGLKAITLLASLNPSADKVRSFGTLSADNRGPSADSSMPWFHHGA
jgi:hypothetical protein